MQLVQESKATGNLRDFMDCKETKFFLIQNKDEISGPYFVAHTGIVFHIGKSYLVNIEALKGTILQIDKMEMDQLLRDWNYQRLLDSRDFKTYTIEG